LIPFFFRWVRNFVGIMFLLLESDFITVEEPAEEPGAVAAARSQFPEAPHAPMTR
jgi:hypothetical protein